MRRGEGGLRRPKPRAARGNRGCAVEGFASRARLRAPRAPFPAEPRARAREPGTRGFPGSRRYSNCFPVWYAPISSNMSRPLDDSIHPYSLPASLRSFSSFLLTHHPHFPFPVCVCITRIKILQDTPIMFAKSRAKFNRWSDTNASVRRKYNSKVK